MIVFESLATPGAGSGELRFDGAARATALSRSAFGFLAFTGRGSTQFEGRAAGSLGFDGQALHVLAGGRALGALGFAGEAAGLVPGAALGFLSFDRGAFAPEFVPVASGDLEFDLSGSGGYIRRESQNVLGNLDFTGYARGTSLGASAVGFLGFEGGALPPADPDAVSGFLVAGSAVFGILGQQIDAVDDVVALGVSARVDLTTLLDEPLRLAVAASTSSEATSLFADRAEFGDAVLLAYQLLIAEGFRGGENSTQAYEAFQRSLDALNMTGGLATEAEAFAVLALGVVFGARNDAVFRESFGDALRLGESLKDDVAQVLALLEGLRAGSTVGTAAVLVAVVPEGLVLGEAGNSAAEAVSALATALRFGLRITLDDGEYTAWVLNTESKHLSSYANFPINSFAEIGGKVYGAGAEGIYLLEGADDAGEPVAAKLRFALSDYGTGKQKRMSAAYLGYTATSDLLLRVIHTDDYGDKTSYTYRMNASTALAPVNGRATFGRGVKSAYFAFELVNVDGGMFDIDTMTAYPLVLERRITRS